MFIENHLKKVNRKYFNTSLFLAKGKNRSEIKWIDFHYWCNIYDNLDGDCETYDADLVEGIESIRKFISEVDTSISG